MSAISRLLVIALLLGSGPSISASLAAEEFRGMTMDDVRRLRGEPERVYGPVGEPPITRWYYANESFYFEHSLVLDRVPHNNSIRLQRVDGLRGTR